MKENVSGCFFLNTVYMKTTQDQCKLLTERMCVGSESKWVDVILSIEPTGRVRMNL